MYRFTDGPLDGLSIGGGVQYIDSAPTSVPIGGNQLSSNRFPTPDSPDRFIFDLSTSYKWMWKDISWNLSLRIANLLDETEETVLATYDNEFGGIENRRTRVYYSPRTWRLSLTVRF